MSDSRSITIPRREFLTHVAGGAATWAAAPFGLAAGQDLPPPPPPPPPPPHRRPRVAAVFTEFRFRSHAWNILENFFTPFLFNGQLVDPGCDVVSFYADQFPAGDVARDVSDQYGIPLFDTIGDALTLGGDELAVDAVVSIGEHGEYPLNERGQRMYPRKRFFDQIAGVVKRAGRGIPIFNDKHLSYRWDWALDMYQTARQLRMPFLAGSSVPLAQRVPAIEVPAGAEIEEAVAIHGGGLESYDFHGLEVLQSFVERRLGGETGISRVELLTGDALKQAGSNGRWSPELVRAAMLAEARAGFRRQARPGGPAGRTVAGAGTDTNAAHAVLVTYKDGLRAAVLKLGSTADRWNFACRIRGEEQPLATALYNGPWGNRCLFKALSHAIQHLFITGRPSYPVERTLLATGVLDAAMQSHHEGGKPINTPHLEFNYDRPDFSRFRETGASWRIITPATPQPTAFEPGDGRFVRTP
ncbi:MAG TPA: hypothetical protein VML55_24375 [Planctomycetaceae bacterium]|nr:hypothetical protein [Planctomycetaceae bacterium]